MLGYSYTVNCSDYPTTLPMVLKEWGGYETYGVGKNHFGWHPNGEYVTHGFDHLKVYDAMTGQPYPDDYMNYFHHLHPGVNVLDVTCHHLGHNDWKACPYGLDHEEEHPTPWTTRQALKYLNDFDFSTNSTNRIFLKVSYHRPHSPYDPPRRILTQRLSRPDTIPARILNHQWDAAYKNTTGPMSPSDWHGDPGDAEARHSRAGYLGSVQFVDEGVGEILEWLQTHTDYNNQNLLDSSMIMWTSDHGDMNGDHYLWRKGYAYEGSSHVNLMMKLPAAATTSQEHQHHSAVVPADDWRLKAAFQFSQNQQKPNLLKQSHALVETRDIAVTMYDFLGLLDDVLKRDPMVDGKSLLPLLTSDNSYTQVRNWLGLEHSQIYTQAIHWNAIVGYYDNDADGTSLLWKYIFNVINGKEELYCLSKDQRQETIDYAPGKAWEPVLQHFREILIEQFTQEGRGTEWVKNGSLVVGRDDHVYGAHYPCRSIHHETTATTTKTGDASISGSLEQQQSLRRKAATQSLV
jgi:arylsulfatase